MKKSCGKIINRDNILINESMKKHTSFKIGGPADFFVEIKTVQELIKVKEFAKSFNIPFFVIGNGSNLLVLDNGIRGIVVKLKFEKLEIFEDECRVVVSSDIATSRLSKICLEHGLSGVEFLSGIPGTIGGAIRMNAGAYGSEMKDVVVKTRCLTDDGKILELTNNEQEFEYRKSVFSKNDYIILETELLLVKDEKENINNKMTEMMEKRREKQPLEFPSAGSTFKRKGDIITAKLIDECGLKGFNIGGAEVSTKHAGFIINKSDATATDVLQLVDYIKKQVYKKFNEEIELEIIIVGE